MGMPFAITYKYRWFGPCEYGDGKKEETTIGYDGSIKAKRLDQNGAKHTWRVIERATGKASPEDVEHLYSKLNDLIHNRKFVELMINDSEEILVIEEPGFKEEFDANLSDGEHYCSQFIEEFLDKVELNWEPVKHK